MNNQETGIIKGQPQQIQSAEQKRAIELVKRLRYMIVNGAKLQDNEVYALAQYAASTQLDPFAGECWYLPGKGPTPGISGWRKKAQEQLEYEARESGEKQGASFWVEYYPAEPGECLFDSDKDIAMKVVLRDSVSQKTWRRALFESLRELSAVGFDKDTAWSMAETVAGKEPVWIGYGVVFSGENFGASEKFDRMERAKKRAEKLALRKRFPRIHLPEPEGIDDVVDYSDYNVVMEGKELSAGQEKTEKENIHMLGFDEEKSETLIVSQPEQPTESRPYSPEALIARLKVMADSYAGQTCDDKKKASVRINISTMAGGEANYPTYLHYLTGYESTTDMPDNWILAVSKWLGVHKDADDAWVIDETAAKEGKAVFDKVFSQ